ncbi:MAG: Ig-like domain-containing protein, partial [Bacteroidota bacterium]
MKNSTIIKFNRNFLLINSLLMISLVGACQTNQKEDQPKSDGLTIQSGTINGKDLENEKRIKNIDFQVKLSVHFNTKLQKEGMENHVHLLQGDKTVPITLSYRNHDSTLVLRNNQPLDYYKKYTFQIDEQIATPFEGFRKAFYTRLDSSNKFPRINEDKLLTKIQKQTFKYFWDHAHPESGLIRERVSSDKTVASGGSGFGLMAIVVGIERDFITREEGIKRLNKILTFLEDETARFHGAWPHWLNGSTGKAIPFSEKDDGGDLVETAYMTQGLLTVREYLNSSDPQEDSLISQINRLWEGIEWDHYTQGED